MAVVNNQNRIFEATFRSLIDSGPGYWFHVADNKFTRTTNRAPADGYLHRRMRRKKFATRNEWAGRFLSPAQNSPLALVSELNSCLRSHNSSRSIAMSWGASIAILTFPLLQWVIRIRMSSSILIASWTLLDRTSMIFLSVLRSLFWWALWPKRPMPSSINWEVAGHWSWRTRVEANPGCA